MYAFTAEQLNTLAEMVAQAEEMTMDGQLVVEVFVKDTDNDTVVGQIGLDENGMFGFMPEV